MTPDQAYDQLETELLAAVAVVAPDQTEAMMDAPTRDVPCGGVAGTDRSKVTSNVRGVIGTQDWDTDEAAARTRLSAFADERGLTVLDPDPKGISLVSSVDGDESFSLSFYFWDNGGIQYRGDTACLDNPDQ